MIDRRLMLFTTMLLPSLMLLTTRSLAETIRWSGYQWRVRSTGGALQGPGPNIFSASKENVFVDNEGMLHLKITKQPSGELHAAEVYLENSLGYGTYEWEVASRYDKLRQDTVLGLFTYLEPSRINTGEVGNGKPDTPHEIDIEMTGSWGDANHFYTTHDPDVKSPSTGFYQSLGGDYTTHRFTWKPDEIKWESFHGHVAGQKSPMHPMVDERPGKREGVPVTHTYSGDVIPKDLNERVHMNLWKFKREGTPLREIDPQEVIIKSFRYTPSSFR